MIPNLHDNIHFVICGPLRINGEGVTQQLQTLDAIKIKVEGHNCTVTKDLCELIDRKVALLRRGLGGATLNGLHTRLLNLFLQFIKNPEFNPGILNWHKH